MDVVAGIRRAFALIGSSQRRWLYVLAAVNIVSAGLDMLGLLLLVPFLAFLGPGGVPSGRAYEIVESTLGNPPPERAVAVLAVVATAMFIAKGIIAVTLVWVQTGVLNRAQVDLSERVLRDFTEAPWLIQQTSGTGALIRTSVNSAESIKEVLAAGVNGVSEAAVFVAVVAAMLIINPVLALAAIVYLAIAAMLVLRGVRRPIERRGSEIQRQAERMNSTVIELVGGIKELSVRNSVDSRVTRFNDSAAAFLAAYRLVQVTNQSMRYLLEAIMIGGAALVIIVATLAGSVTTVLVSIGVLLAGGLRLIPALNALLIDVNVVRSSSPAIAIVEDEIERFSRVREIAASSMETTHSTTRDYATGITLEDVSFRYPTRSEYALSGVSLQIDPGESIGVVGASGSGKSSFVDVLLGFLEPTTGQVLIDGSPIREDLVAWRGRIGYVPQDIFISDTTLRENVLFGKRADVAGNSISDAIRLAHLTDVVLSLPDGIDTVLGERGVQLSGGQRQRVGLARALYGGPSILVLDEATSALDNETEQAINDALTSLHGSLTTVVVAHRLSTVRLCDRILYLDHGRVAGLGTFDELRASSPGFARMVELGSLENL